MPLFPSSNRQTEPSLTSRPSVWASEMVPSPTPDLTPNGWSAQPTRAREKRDGLQLSDGRVQSFWRMMKAAEQRFAFIRFQMVVKGSVFWGCMWNWVLLYLHWMMHLCVCVCVCVHCVHWKRSCVTVSQLLSHLFLVKTFFNWSRPCFCVVNVELDINIPVQFRYSVLIL